MAEDIEQLVIYSKSKNFHIHNAVGFCLNHKRIEEYKKPGMNCFCYSFVKSYSCSFSRLHQDIRFISPMGACYEFHIDNHDLFGKLVSIGKKYFKARNEDAGVRRIW